LQVRPPNRAYLITLAHTLTPLAIVCVHGRQHVCHNVRMDFVEIQHWGH